MQKLLAAVAFAGLIGSCAGGAVPGLFLTEPAPVTAASAHIAAAVADPRRPEADTARDALRLPAEIMAFSGVSEGWRVADVGPGAGYYARLFAVAVGDAGRVYAIDRPGTAERPRPMAAIAPTYSNITHLMDGYNVFNVGEPLDAIFISQIYHDFYLPVFAFDVPALNRALFNALKPGGVLIIIDHSAVAGSDIGVTNTLHRIDRAQVVRDMEATGFILDAESDVLRHPEDNRTLRVFESDIRGRTDQFVLRFRKPA